MHNGLHRVHCAEMIVSVCLCVSAKKSETGGGGWGHCRMLCTQQLLDLVGHG